MNVAMITSWLAHQIDLKRRFFDIQSGGWCFLGGFTLYTLCLIKSNTFLIN